ncbi:uncharacterized protein YdeI (YjbR/CyaY-like superfamily) [Novosphingobium sp. SG751A]|uniref:YdeI/OmpD-associated family protein n=1 Tax=Novosphingobium sp. SG751A TaxID=2587000 RepID=UPI0015574A35|nr:YdeI/OmpD-associated family protein [Novosphingobium sp. SG751A]NOW44247.1 uncharacterized protein YdeI (YjbR/CyaY-like superfamily) [Novosphingobium sp. SG751A]
MDQRIDAYIAAAPDFARPILTHLRRAVHEAVPGLGETIKWSMPHFTLNGKNLAGMAAFKAHCAFVIHGAGRQGAEEGRRDDGLGAYGKIASMDDLPDADTFRMRLVEAAQGLSGAKKAPRAPKAPKPEIAVPDDLTAALAENAAAGAVFAAFAPSHRRDYLEWIVEAKAPATRARRITQAVEWMAEGKRRNWKYEKC